MLCPDWWRKKMRGHTLSVHITCFYKFIHLHSNHNYSVSLSLPHISIWFVCSSCTTNCQLYWFISLWDAYSSVLIIMFLDNVAELTPIPIFTNLYAQILFPFQTFRSWFNYLQCCPDTIYFLKNWWACEFKIIFFPCYETPMQPMALNSSLWRRISATSFDWMLNNVARCETSALEMLFSAATHR